MGITYNTSIVRNGLVLHLDAANPKSYPGSGTTWTDLSGRGNNGTLQNGLIFSSGELFMDGGDELINIPPTNLEFLGTSDFSLETIVRSTNVNYPRSRHPFKFFHTVFDNTTPGWSVGHTGSSSSIEIRCSDGINSNVTTLQHTAIAESTFYYRTFTVSRNSGLLTKHYINASYIGEVNANSVTGSIYNASSDATSSGLTFGYVWGWRYIGGISLIRIYNRTLTAAEIRQNFEALRGRYGI